MIYQFAVPPMDGTDEMRILEWHKSEGDSIGADELLVELETDKAVVEIRSPVACVLRKIAVVQGGWAPVGPPIAWFSDTPEEQLEMAQAKDFAPLWEVM
jgi:pyruvate/2-oxoglutarate dehydrogenase complex dihydrolipoamide acyltransferase (E2) component